MKYLRSFGGLVFVFGEAVLVCWWVFHAYGAVIEQASNADSLTIIDFSRDLLRGVPLGGWNLPRSPYLFPDVLIASLVMLFGWSNNFTIFIIASINYSLLIITCYVVLKNAYGLKRISLPGIGLMVSLSLLAIAYVFPVFMFNVYWQLFASGTHFGAAVVVLLMLSLNKILFRNSGVLLRVFALCSFTVALVVSDVMALFLLMLWIASEMLSEEWKHPKARTDMIVIFFSAIIGAVLSFMIPCQSLWKSFLSMHKFIRGCHLFSGWFFNSFGNVAFILLLVISSVAFSFLMQGRWPKSRKNVEQMSSGQDFVLPSLGLIAVFPMFFQDFNCLRYLIFPAIILILCVVLAYLRLIGLVKDNRIRAAILFFWFLLICFGILFVYKKTKTEPANESNAAKIYQCIKRASLVYPLQDGIASYWNARPLRFYSNFEYYLAQVSPWAPKDGYFYWGNNRDEFVYRDVSTKLYRKYNYIVASNDEIKSGLWGNVINKSKNKVICREYTLFYFDQGDILWDFLFFHGLPH